MKKYETDSEGREVTEEEANAIDELNEDFPDEPLPKKNLPELNKLDPDEPKDESEGLDKALGQMEEYDK